APARARSSDAAGVPAPPAVLAAPKPREALQPWAPTLQPAWDAWRAALQPARARAPRCAVPTLARPMAVSHPDREPARGRPGGRGVGRLAVGFAGFGKRRSAIAVAAVAASTAASTPPSTAVPVLERVPRPGRGLAVLAGFGRLALAAHLGEIFRLHGRLFGIR